MRWPVLFPAEMTSGTVSVRPCIPDLAEARAIVARLLASGAPVTRG